MLTSTPSVACDEQVFPAQEVAAFAMRSGPPSNRSSGYAARDAEGWDWPRNPFEGCRIARARTETAITLGDVFALAPEVRPACLAGKVGARAEAHCNLVLVGLAELMSRDALAAVREIEQIVATLPKMRDPITLPRGPVGVCRNVLKQPDDKWLTRIHTLANPPVDRQARVALGGSDVRLMTLVKVSDGLPNISRGIVRITERVNRRQPWRRIAYGLDPTTHAAALP